VTTKRKTIIKIEITIITRIKDKKVVIINIKKALNSILDKRMMITITKKLRNNKITIIKVLNMLESSSNSHTLKTIKIIMISTLKNNHTTKLRINMKIHIEVVAKLDNTRIRETQLKTMKVTLSVNVISFYYLYYIIESGK
jgi:hypothetical protein